MNDRELAIAAYHEAIMRAAEYGDPEIERLLKRQLAQSDLFFLLVYVLGRADLNRDWYFERCREVQAAPNGYLDLWGREHGKSSLITFGLTTPKSRSEFFRIPDLLPKRFSDRSRPNSRTTRCCGRYAGG